MIPSSYSLTRAASVISESPDDQSSLVDDAQLTLNVVEKVGETWSDAYLPCIRSRQAER